MSIQEEPELTKTRRKIGFLWSQSCTQVALLTWAAGGLFAWGVAHFCGTRCYLIDWSARTELTSVPFVSTQEALDGYIERHEPAILHDALRSWPAVSKWTPAFFGKELGGQAVEVYFWGKTGADWRRSRIFGMTLAEYATLLDKYTKHVKLFGVDAAGPAPYLQEDEFLFDENEAKLIQVCGIACPTRKPANVNPPNLPLTGCTTLPVPTLPYLRR